MRRGCSTPALKTLDPIGSDTVTPTPATGDIDLGGYFAIIRERWLWVLATVVALSGLAAAYTLTQADVYQATARVLLADSAAQESIDGTLNNVNARSRDLANEINIAESDQTTAIVRDRLGLADDGDLPTGKISADSNSDVIEFTFNARSAEQAAMFANTWAEAYVDVKQLKAEASIAGTVTNLEGTLRELRDDRTALRTDLDALELRLANAAEGQREGLQFQVDQEASSISGELNLIDARIQANIQSITTLQLSGELAAVGEAELSQRAVAPLKPSNAPLSRTLPVAIVLGLFLGAGVATIVNNLDQSISSPEDLAELGLSTLTMVPKATREQKRGELALAGINSPGSPIADAYQKARTALQFASISNDMRSIVVTSANQSEGKTTTSVNLAIAFSSVGQRVVLADADLRRPRIHAVFGTALTPGLTDSILDSVPVDSLAIRTAGSPETLAALPAGTQPPNPAPFLASTEFSRLTDSLVEASDLLIFDAPPVLAVADSLSIAHNTDGVVLVVSAGSTKREEIRRSLDSIRQAGGEVLGAVLIGVDDTGRYGNYYGEPLPEAAPAASRNRFATDPVDLRDDHGASDSPAPSVPEDFVPRARLLGS